MKRFFIAGIWLLCSGSAWAQYGYNNSQRRPEHSFYYDYGQLIYTETVNLTADDSSLSRILTNFRIAYDALTFEKPIFSEEQSNTFTASVNVRADLLDEHEVTVQRASWSDTVRVQSYLETNDKFKFVVGSILFDVKPGTYTLVWTVEDGANRETLREQRVRITARDMQAAPIVFSKPLIAALLDGNGIIPRALGGNAEFGSPMTVYTELTARQTPSVTYELIHNKNGDSTVVAKGTADVKNGARISLHNNRCCTMGAAAGSGRYYCSLTVSGDSLETGDYTLRLHAAAGGDSRDTSSVFKVIWSNMPLSLSDLDYAIDAMRYILTDDQLDSMKNGDKAERKKKFEAYWRSQDPTPGTVYNERETEYYHRVDYSYFNFRNPIKPDDDGMRTDRGKIFILYGKPTGIDRRLLPDGPAEEVWTYHNNIGKQFIFHDEDKNGTYRLAQVLDLK